ncbi:hypothetical protein KTR66_23720 [Roseococcus sp. SDR]|uniref:hypothetical protein n=1 Tax=Roseococcus sp. SDR TaxID=2835532 RepID=UPI001BD184D7|nr:hypothetical protein [Roseococcus sp. SDR]MBS7793011.1 hypothetical protein [Roseococcus sp. SDR]MBV1848325.1 hypothetical protein [Roseococcus sp. SDR]
MRVYTEAEGQRRLVGRADIPDDVGAIFELNLFGVSSTISEHFVVATITHLGPAPHDIRVERVILLGMGQRPEILPGWQPLAS